MLEISRDYLRRALRLTPASDSELLLRRGSLLSILAHIIMSRVEIARQQGAEPVAIKAARDTARIYLRSALDELIAAQEQGAEYFKTHFELALICQGLATLATSPEERRKYDALYEIELRLSHRFNPSFDSPIVFLLDRFESQRQPSDPELARWRKLLLAQAPDRYSERYAEPLAEAMKLGEFARAHWFLDVIQIDQPKEPIYRFSEALLLARQGESAAAQDLLKRLKSEFPDFELYPDFAAIVALFARDWPEARRWAEEALAGKSNRRDLPMMETVRAYAAEAAGDPDGARLVARVERLAMQDNKKEAVPWLDAASNVLHVHLGQTERALPFMRRRAGIFEPTGPDEIFLVELARHTDNLDAARGYLKEALIAQPRNREALALVAEKFGGASSPEAGRILAEAAEERRARDRAERAKSFRELMDSQGF
jgi:tetratricopeptide (TPR) repeat protein